MSYSQFETEFNNSPNHRYKQIIIEKYSSYAFENIDKVGKFINKIIEYVSDIGPN
jgi:hypothetical protein